MLKFKEWWQDIGSWQLVMIVITLATFFITLHFTGDTEKAALATALVTAVTLATALVTLATALVTLATAVAAALVAVAAVAAAAGVAATALVAGVAAAGVAAAALVAALVALGGVVFAGEGKVNKKTIYLSFVVQFIVILLPMLGIILHWW